MANYTATDFDLKENQKAERKLLVTAVKVDDAIIPIGVGVEDSSISYETDSETVTDIMGITEENINSINMTQSLEPMTVRGGNKLLFKLVDILERNAISELSGFEVYLIRAYINEDSSGGTPKYHAEKHINCTIRPTGEGGSAYVDMPIEITFSNDKTLGTVNGYKKTDTIAFTANSAS